MPPPMADDPAPAGAIEQAILRYLPRTAGSVIERGGRSGAVEAGFRSFAPDVAWGSAGDAAAAVILHSAALGRDPGAAMAAAAEALAPDGTIVAALPLRPSAGGGPPLFGRDTIGAALAPLGLVPIDAHPAGEGISIVRIGRRAVRPLVIQHALLTEGSGGTTIRIREPAEFLATLPGVESLVVDINKPIPILPPGTDKVLVMQRRWLDRARALAALRQARAAGYVTVMEMDDHPDFHPGYEQHDYINFRGVHAIQVTTEALAEALRPLNPNVRVLRTQVAALPPFAQRQGPHVSLIFAALNRQEDWKPYLGALNRALQARPRLRTMVLYDHDFYAALETEDRKAYAPFQPLAVYKRALSRADIVFMPLGDTPFNRCKSDLKFLDAACAGAVALASPTVYAGTVADGRTGMLFDTADALERRLLTLIDDDAGRAAIARAAHDHVRRERLLSHHIADRLLWYKSLIADRARLDQELVARLPELADAPFNPPRGDEPRT